LKVQNSYSFNNTEIPDVNNQLPYSSSHIEAGQMHLEDNLSEAFQRKDSRHVFKSDVSIDSVTLLSSIAATSVEQSAGRSALGESDGTNGVLKLGGDIVAVAVGSSDGHGTTDEAGFREECCEDTGPY
jgi:hypothetical protein